MIELLLTSILPAIIGIFGTAEILHDTTLEVRELISKGEAKIIYARN